MNKKILISINIFIILFLIYTIRQEQITTVINYPELIYHGSRESKYIYLTFDDGYPAKNTKQIVQILKDKNVPATFFLEGDFLANHKPILLDMISNNMIIGCHTMDHNDITTESNKSFEDNLIEFENLYYQLTDEPLTRFFRPPMGRINQDKIDILEERGYLIFMWDVNYKDYDPYNELGVDYAYKYVLENTQNGSIILLHTLTKTNVEALPKIIDGLRDEGYIFGSLYNFAY